MKSSSIDYTRHPCFNPGVKGQFGRVHLPVAPKCNIKCNYCNRKYDCVNESRPGVTSTVLTPAQAVEYMSRVLEKEPRITVAGIAGPGDPFANPDETMGTLRLIRSHFPGIILCLASNGLAIGPHIDELGSMNVSHVTITVNAVDPEIGSRIYGWFRDGKVIYRGVKGAELLLGRQLEAIRRLKEQGITVKVNFIAIPGINTGHVGEVARAMRDLGVDLFPNVDTPFAHLEQPDKALMAKLREEGEKFLPQMRHCTRCRADAVGLLDDDRTDEFRGCLSACAAVAPDASRTRPYVAVATMEGVLVNQHLGEARTLQIWKQLEEGGYALVEERETPAPGEGMRRWVKLSRILGDCRALLTAGIGEKPYDVLKKSGIQPYEVAGFIEAALEAVLGHGDASTLKRRKISCSGGCSGSGGGCL